MSKKKNKKKDTLVLEQIAFYGAEDAQKRDADKAAVFLACIMEENATGDELDALCQGIIDNLPMLFDAGSNVVFYQIVTPGARLEYNRLYLSAQFTLHAKGVQYKSLSFDFFRDKDYQLYLKAMFLGHRKVQDTFFAPHEKVVDTGYTDAKSKRLPNMGSEIV